MAFQASRLSQLLKVYFTAVVLRMHLIFDQFG